MGKYKYEHLKQFLDRAPAHINALTLTFAQIELIIGDELPPGAYKYPAGWANHKGFARARGWLPHWRTGHVRVEEQRVTFTRAVGERDPGSKKQGLAGKYDPLRAFLKNVVPDASEITLGFQQIEAILGFDLSPSARKYQEWWANPGTTRGHSYAQAWFAAGWQVDTVNLDAEWVRFWRSS
jgi:hypothetical protein